MNLDPRLESSSSFVIDLDLCQVRLNHNAAFPWLLLIPKRGGIVELIDLGVAEQRVLMQEIVLVSQVMRDLFRPHKLNVASFGNVVPQLHIHIIARFETDPAWPNPVWNTVTETYSRKRKDDLITCLNTSIIKNLEYKSVKADISYFV